MTSTIGLKSPDWAVYQSEYAEIDSYPLMSSPLPVLLILATYLLFVLKIGPSFMKDRKPYIFNNTLIIYNAVQVALSVYMAQRYIRFLLDTSILHSKCYINEDVYRKEILTNIWIYFIAKVTELLDTVFFILRKKNNQVTFLHVYHHSIMMFGTWGYLKYAPSENIIFIGAFNSVVHVIMYSYYGLAAMGPSVAKYLKWKKYITSLQLIQFVSMIVHYLMTVKYSDCPPSKSVIAFILSNIVAFLFLFGNFYRQSYLKNKQHKLEKQQNGVEKIKAL